MLVILGYTNNLSECLQRRDQDILTAINFVGLAKSRMQELRSDGWDAFLQKVTLFCNKHGIEVPAMEDAYVPYGRSTRFSRPQKMMITLEEKFILGLLIKLFKSLIIALMRSIWSCFLVWRLSVPPTNLPLLMHARYIDLLSSTPMIFKAKI
jgi:hypothetical protein